ncbi:MAG: hypothetical protein WA405_10255 [Candidatus Acidiferrales bacterium]
MLMKSRANFGIVLLAEAALVSFALFAAQPARAQVAAESDPVAALSGALAAACRADETQFASYLTADNAAAFHALPQNQRTEFLKRFSLSDGPGKPLLSTDAQNHIILRCETPQQTAEFRFGAARTKENLSFITVTVVNSQQTDFGLVREGGGWKLLSLGLMLLDVPQLAKRWADEDIADHEDAAIAALRNLADAVESYRRAFGNLPQSLAQLGPAPKDEVTPDQASLVDAQLAAGSEGGYRFSYRVVSAADGTSATFEVAATPEDYGKSGRRSFFLDQEGKIHGADSGGAAVTTDAPVVAAEKTP